MISRTLGAPFGGTTRGGHQGVDSEALSLITPPNFGSGGGSWLPGIVVVPSGEPTALPTGSRDGAAPVPVPWVCALASPSQEPPSAVAKAAFAVVSNSCRRFIGRLSLWLRTGAVPTRE